MLCHTYEKQLPICINCIVQHTLVSMRLRSRHEAIDRKFDKIKGPMSINLDTGSYVCKQRMPNCKMKKNL